MPLVVQSLVKSDCVPVDFASFAAKAFNRTERQTGATRPARSVRLYPMVEQGERLVCGDESGSAGLKF